MTSMIGLGYYDTITPPVLRRNILENPAWYTAYTPYQPEISQGRLEALLNFQTMVSDLTGLDIASASLLDEATAAAEAMALCRRSSKVGDDAVFVIDRDCHPQTIAVVETRAEPLGLRVVITDVAAEGLPEGDIFGVLVQYPASSGRLVDWSGVIAEAHERGALASVAADLLALCLLRSPGAMGADVAVGSAQRFGVPMGFGGPHAGFMSVRGVAALVAGATGRCVDRCRRRSRVSPRAADARAAHPPREGHVEHLHRASAPGGDGVDVRGVPRAGWTLRHRRASARARPRGRGPGRRRARRVLRHRPTARAWSSARDRRGRGRTRHQHPRSRRRHRRHRVRRGHDG